MNTNDKQKKKENILSSIKPEEALYVLKCLMKDDSRITDKVYRIMLKRLKQVNIESIESDVYSALDFLEVEDLWDR